MFFVGEYVNLNLQTIDGVQISTGLLSDTLKKIKDVRYIILHVGSEHGFVNNAGLVFRSGIKSMVMIL